MILNFFPIRQGIKILFSKKSKQIVCTMTDVFNYFSTSVWDVSKTYELTTTGEIITFELNVIMVMIDTEYQRLGNLYLLLPF